MKACIIEDEPHARRALQRLLEAVAPDVEVVGSAAGVEEGVALLNRTHPDLVLLDVQLGTHNGFDLLHHFPDPGFSLIFVTAYNHFALDAFRWNAVHYITKPIDSRELQQGIEKVRKEQARLQPIQVQWYDKSKNVLLLSTGHEIPVSRRTRDHLNDWLNRASL